MLQNSADPAVPTKQTSGPRGSTGSWALPRQSDLSAGGWTAFPSQSSNYDKKGLAPRIGESSSANYVLGGDGEGRTASHACLAESAHA